MAFQTAPPPPCVDQLQTCLPVATSNALTRAGRRPRIAEADRHLALEHARRTGDERGVVRHRAWACSTAPCPSSHRARSAGHRACRRTGVPAEYARPRTPAPARNFLPATLVTPGSNCHSDFAGERIDRVDHAVAGGDVDDAVDRQRRGLRVADVEIERPRELQSPDRLAIDFSERAVVSLAGRATDGRPVAGVELGAQRRLICRGRRRGTKEQRSGNGETQATMDQPAAGAASGNSGAAVTRPLKSSH